MKGKIFEEKLNFCATRLWHIPQRGGGMVRLRLWLPEIAYFKVDKIVNKLLITFCCLIVYIIVYYYFCSALIHLIINRP